MSDLGNKEIMAKNIKRLMELNNVTQTDICNALKFKPSTFSDWVNAKTYPRIDKIEMLANYFGVEKSDLVEDRSGSNSNYIPDHFETVTDAMEFILRVPVVANNCGYDLDVMSDEEIIEMAEDLSEMLQIMAKKHRKK